MNLHEFLDDYGYKENMSRYEIIKVLKSFYLATFSGSIEPEILAEIIEEEYR